MTISSLFTSQISQPCDEAPAMKQNPALDRIHALKQLLMILTESQWKSEVLPGSHNTENEKKKYTKKHIIFQKCITFIQKLLKLGSKSST